MATSSTGYAEELCARTLTAEVVALDMPLMWNRLGAQNINGMMFALKEDVVKIDSYTGELTPMSDFTEDDVKAASGNVTLRPDKRPRPLVLRTGEGDCLTITLYNLLKTPANPFPNPADGGDPTVRSNVEFRLHNDNQVAERKIGLRFTGTELVSGIEADATNVGKNPDATIALHHSHATRRRLRRYQLRRQDWWRRARRYHGQRPVGSPECGPEKFGVLPQHADQ
jgi:hypothetical protein